MLSEIIRDNIKALVPYSSARSEYSGAASILLDANENCYGSGADLSYNRYPDPLQQVLKRRIAVLKGIPEQQLFLGNGSDEPIDLLIRICCTPGQDNILIMPPTYGMYEVAAKINNIAVKEVPLTAEFAIDLEAVLAAIDPNTRIIFICSPNNPTGNLLDAAAIRQIVRSFNGIVVIDEAYIDFAAAGSLYKSLSGCWNVVVLQTFSKAWGMAGLRLGMAMGTEELITVLNKVKAPYNISTPVQELVLKALDNESQVIEWISKIIEEREWLRRSLTALPVVLQVYPSDANFLLVRVNDVTGVYQYLAANNIIVRDRSRIEQCRGCLRITIGRREEHQALLDALQQYSLSK